MKFTSKILLCGLFVTATVVYAKTVNIKDLGARAGINFDSGPAIEKALSFAAKNPGTTVLVPEGKFYIKTLYKKKTNSSIQKYHIYKRGLKNLTIKGQGSKSELIFSHLCGGILFEESTNIKLQNLVFDYAFKTFSQGRIESVSNEEGSITLLADPGYPVPDNNEKLFESSKASWLTINYDGMNLAFPLALRAKKTQVLSDGKTVKFFHNKKLPNFAHKDKLRYVRVSRLGTEQLIRFNFCKGVELDNIAIHASSGMAVLMCMCENVKIVNSKIIPRPGSGDAISTCADGMHFIGGKGSFVVDNNIFDALQDDNVNFILRGNLIDSLPQADTLNLKITSATYYETGDTVRIYDCSDYSFSDYKISSVTKKRSFPAQSFTIKLDRPVNEKIVLSSEKNTLVPRSLVFNRSWSFGNALVTNNRFLNNRARAVRISASGITVKNNYFEKAAFAPILVHSVVETWRGVYDAFSDNISIDSNTIIKGLNNGGFAGYKGAICVEAFSWSTKKTLKNSYVMKDIRIVNNTIIDSGKAGIACANTDGLVIENNNIIHPNVLLGVNSKSRYAIYLDSVKNYRLKDNKVSRAKNTINCNLSSSQ